MRLGGARGVSLKAGHCTRQAGPGQRWRRRPDRADVLLLQLEDVRDLGGDPQAVDPAGFTRLAERADMRRGIDPARQAYRRADRA